MKQVAAMLLVILPSLFLISCGTTQVHGLVYTSSSTVWILNPTDLSKRELAHGAGHAVGLSHDLRRMAFSKDSQDLWVADIGGGNAKQIISDQFSGAGLSINRIAWAPDDRKLAVWALPSRAAGVNPEEFTLYVVDPSIGTVQLIDKGIAAFHWTVDAKRLVVVRKFHPDKPTGIFLVQDDGLTWNQLYDGLVEFIAVSPVSDAVAFVASKTGHGLPDSLFVRDPSTGTSHDVLQKFDPLPTDIGFPVWSADGNRLAFTAQVPYRDNLSISALFTVDVRTLVVTKLAEDITAPLAWSPDGRSIAGAGGFLPHGLYKIDVETGEMSKLSDDQMVIPYSFEWR